MSENPHSTPPEKVSIATVLVYMLEQLAQVSWSKLGLQPDIMTGKLEQDLAEAKLAIDATAALAAVIEPELDDSDRRRVQSMVRDLRMNYVQRTQEGGV